jgi:hypothetical protein
MTLTTRRAQTPPPSFPGSYYAKAIAWKGTGPMPVLVEYLLQENGADHPLVVYQAGSKVWAPLDSFIWYGPVSQCIVKNGGKV